MTVAQKKIVKKIIEKGADYSIGLKQNQPELYQDTKDYFDSFTKFMAALNPEFFENLFQPNHKYFFTVLKM